MRWAELQQVAASRSTNAARAIVLSPTQQRDQATFVIHPKQRQSPDATDDAVDIFRARRFPPASLAHASIAFDPAVVSLIDALPWPVILIEENGNVSHVNTSMKKARAETVSPHGRHLRNVFPEYCSALSGEIPWLTPQTANVRGGPPGRAHGYEQIWLRKLAQGACLIVMDQTGQHKPELSNAQTIRLASLGFMLASVSHEVSNPLTAICSMVQILQSKRGVTPAALEMGLQNIASSVRRILSITRKLNGFSRVDDEPQLAFSIDSAVEEAIVLFAYDSLGESVQVTHMREPRAVVSGMPGQLQQVFFNILLNAAQAMKGHGSISVATRLVGTNNVEISIRDTGPGLHPEDIPRIFEPFFTTKPGGEGTGLGLAISNEIVHEHDGNLSVENHPEGGACFRICIPCAKHSAMVLA